MRAPVRSTTLAVMTVVALGAPLAASAEGLQRIARGSGRTVIHVEGPVTLHVQPSAPTAPSYTRSDDLWGAPAVRPPPYRCCDAPPRGLLPSAAVSTQRSYAATSQALDPIVDPLLEATTHAAGTAAGTALGIGLYAPVKVLEHVTGVR
jgi:hypothetical protein